MGCQLRCPPRGWSSSSLPVEWPSSTRSDLASSGASARRWASAAHAEGMTAAYLPAILTPIVGLAFPGASMALWFIYVSKDQE